MARGAVDKPVAEPAPRASSTPRERVLEQEIEALKARLEAKIEEGRALKAEVVARTQLIARLRAGEDPAGVYPTGLGTHDGPTIDRTAPVRRAVAPIREDLDQLRADLSTHFALLNAARMDVAARDSTITELRLQLGQTSARLAEIDAQYHLALEAVRERGEAQRVALDDRQAVAQALAAAEARNAERAAALDQMAAAKARLEGELAEALTHRRSAEALAAERAATIEGLVAQGVAQATALEQLAEAKARLEAEVATALAQRQAAEALAAERAAAIDALVARHADVLAAERAAHEAVRADLDSWRAQATTLAAALGDAEARVRAARKVITQRDQALTAQRAALATAKMRIAELETARQADRDTHDALSRRLERALEERDAGIADQGRLSATIGQLETALTAARAALDQRTAEHAEADRAAQSALRAARDAQVTLDARVVALEAALQNRAQELDAARVEIADGRLQREHLLSAAAGLESDRIALERTFAAERRQAHDREVAAVAAARAAAEELSAAISTAHAERTRHAAAEATLKTQIARVRAELRAAQRDLAARRAQIDQLTDDLATAHLTIAALTPKPIEDPFAGTGRASVEIDLLRRRGTTDRASEAD